MQGLWLTHPPTPLVDLFQKCHRALAVGVGRAEGERKEAKLYGKVSSKLREGPSQLVLQVEILEDSAKDHSRIQAGMELHWASGSTLSLLNINDAGGSQEQ